MSSFARPLVAFRALHEAMRTDLRHQVVDLYEAARTWRACSDHSLPVARNAMIARAGPTALAKLLLENSLVYSLDRCPVPSRQRPPFSFCGKCTDCGHSLIRPCGHVAACQQPRWSAPSARHVESTAVRAEVWARLGYG